MAKIMEWPIRVICSVTKDGKRHRIRRTMEAACNAEGAMLAAVICTPDPYRFVGARIVGYTVLGQRIVRVVKQDGGILRLEKENPTAEDRLSKCASELFGLKEGLAFADWEMRAFHAPSECWGDVCRGVERQAREVLEKYGFRNMEAFEKELAARTCAKFVYQIGFGELTE